MTESSANLEVPEVSPPWGAFPAEQYLLHHWSPGSSGTGQDQRRRLINDFVHVLDTIPKEWVLKDPTPETMAIAPSPSQVQEILAPWRPLRWRSAAWEIWNEMREDEEEKAQDGSTLEEWFDEYVDDNPNGEEPDEIITWSVLDDESVFNFGDDWERVFEVIPELSGPREGLSRLFGFKESNQSILEEEYKNLREQVSSFSSLQDRISAVESSDNFAQFFSVDSYLFVADKRAFLAGELLVLFLDKKGNYVRKSRVPLPNPDLWLFGMSIDNAKLLTTSGWTNESPPGSSLNPKYRAFGEIGRKLYRVDDLLQV